MHTILDRLAKNETMTNIPHRVSQLRCTRTTEAIQSDSRGICPEPCLFQSHLKNICIVTKSGAIVQWHVGGSLSRLHPMGLV
jgi:hypothetical protein